MSKSLQDSGLPVCLEAGARLPGRLQRHFLVPKPQCCPERQHLRTPPVAVSLKAKVLPLRNAKLALHSWTTSVSLSKPAHLRWLQDFDIEL